MFDLQYSEEDRKKSSQEKAEAGLIRGIGTDVGIVSSMVFLAQFILSLSMGTIISMAGTTTAVIGESYESFVRKRSVVKFQFQSEVILYVRWKSC